MTQPDDLEPPDDRSSAGVAGPRARELSTLPAFLRRQAADDVGTRPRGGGLPASLQAIRPVVATAPDPSQLPMVGISPRRLLLAVAMVAVAWSVISFGRQVAAASAASAHAVELRAANAGLAAEVAALQGELQLIGEPRYIDQQARAYRLGGPHEVPFALEGSPPKLPPDAPGSAAQRLGADPLGSGPLDAWLGVLFGPGG
jgi:cell division protein FtsB